MTATTGPRRTQELARLLTHIEAEDPAALGAAVRSEVEVDKPCHVVGLTGAPGAGKSTLTGALINGLRTRGQTVGVLAVDPSSTRTGGALLGDRLRMVGGDPDPDVFIRSMASRGSLGGLATAAPAAVAALAGAGYDVVLVETVGAGQSEIDVAQLADTTVVVMAPGMGDAVQALKAGLLEVADVFVVNKADRGGAGQTESQIRGMLYAGEPPGEAAWRPAITRTVAVRAEGVDDLLGALDRHRAWLRGTAEHRRRRDERLDQVLRGAVMRQVMDRLADDAASARLRGLAEQVGRGEMTLGTAAERLLGSLTR